MVNSPFSQYYCPEIEIKKIFPGICQKNTSNLLLFAQAGSTRPNKCNIPAKKNWKNQCLVMIMIFR